MNKKKNYDEENDSVNESDDEPLDKRKAKLLKRKRSISEHEENSSNSNNEPLNIRKEKL